jgi:predicted transcriptional regulator
MPSKAETLSVRLPNDVKRKVDDIAHATKRSRSFIIKEAVASYVNGREAYLRDLDAALKSADSGVGHSGEQIFGWMETWGTAEEAPSPAPDIVRGPTGR